MTYKRFTYIPFDGFKDLDKELDAYEVLNLLNELHEENQELKKEVKDLKQAVIRAAFGG